MIKVPRVRSPCSALSPCCWAVSLFTGALGVSTALGSNCVVCQMKSWSRLPSFLDNSSCLDWVTTSRKSFTRALPSGESLSAGVVRALEARKLLRATSIWSFWRSRGQKQSIGLAARITTYRWNLAVLERSCDAVDLELPVHVGLLGLHVDGFIDVGHDYFCSWCWNSLL